MRKQKKLTWESPLMQIASVDIRRSKETGKDYAVIKVYTDLEPPLHQIRTIFRKGKKTTLLCFKNSLLPLFQPDNFHIFEGEISFDWGSTYLCITKLFDDSGNRLLRSDKKDNEEKLVTFWEFRDPALIANEETVKTERKQREHKDYPCNHNCDECLDQDCSDCPLY